ncbi:hypothetical protein N0V90_008460 [Kalmusia sp. IMI 367209]|nr:hypothetical protein N0V90_008460 [Kalmusia sp. IMI 367209]
MMTETGISDFLLPVLLYIGSIFSRSISSSPFGNAAAEAMQAGWMIPGLAPNPYFIQALMLYSISVYWCNEPERGRELLDEAINGAFILGMHQKDFAEHNGNGDPVLEESWRRTWWQIHVTDVHIAGSLHIYKGLSNKFPITTELPCEEQCYETGVIPVPASLKNYNTREFSDIEFSSFAQLIGFTQGISRVLATREYKDIENAKVTSANADTMITAWCSLLPASKRRPLRDDGSVDELLFKANILMHTYIVDLHRQLSYLQYSAIESISKYIFHEPKLLLERDKIRLKMGVLKMLGEYWPAGQREYQTMGIIAREILALKEEEFQIPKETPILPLDTLDFNFDFEVNWACDLFANGTGPFHMDLSVGSLV